MRTLCNVTAPVGGECYQGSRTGRLGGDLGHTLVRDGCARAGLGELDSAGARVYVYVCVHVQGWEAVAVLWGIWSWGTALNKTEKISVGVKLSF